MQTQLVTQNDLNVGKIRIPRATKVMFPEQAATVDLTLRGRALSVKWAPGVGPDKERSGVLSIGKAVLAELVRPNEVLQVTSTESGLVLS